MMKRAFLSAVALAALCGALPVALPGRPAAAEGPGEPVSFDLKIDDTVKKDNPKAFRISTYQWKGFLGSAGTGTEESDCYPDLWSFVDEAFMHMDLHLEDAELSFDGQVRAQSDAREPMEDSYWGFKLEGTMAGTLSPSADGTAWEMRGTATTNATFDKKSDCPTPRRTETVPLEGRVVGKIFRGSPSGNPWISIQVGVSAGGGDPKVGVQCLDCVLPVEVPLPVPLTPEEESLQAWKRAGGRLEDMPGWKDLSPEEQQELARLWRYFLGLPGRLRSGDQADQIPGLILEARRFLQRRAVEKVLEDEYTSEQEIVALIAKKWLLAALKREMETGIEGSVHNVVERLRERMDDATWGTKDPNILTDWLAKEVDAALWTWTVTYGATSAMQARVPQDAVKQWIDGLPEAGRRAWENEGQLYGQGAEYRTAEEAADAIRGKYPQPVSVARSDYAAYRKEYEAGRGQGKTPEQAHEQARRIMEDVARAKWARMGGDQKDKIVLPDFIEAYEEAYKELNDRLTYPQVSGKGGPQ